MPKEPKKKLDNYGRISLTVRIKDTIYDRTVQKAREMNMSISSLVTHMLDSFVDEVEIVARHKEKPPEARRAAGGGK